MAFYIELGALLIALFLLYVFLRFVKNPLVLLVNAIAGVLLIFVLNWAFHLGVELGLLGLGVLALGGVPAAILILILHFLGIAF